MMSSNACSYLKSSVLDALPLFPSGEHREVHEQVATIVVR
jgi:hypothetical protein